MHCRSWLKKVFTPFIPPILCKEFSFINTGHFPWGKTEAFKTSAGKKSEDQRWLAGTAEVPLVSYNSGEILNEKDLPKKYAGFSSCYRREIGNYGKDSKGIYRIYEFMKIEQVILCVNDMKESEKWLEKLLKKLWRNSSGIRIALQGDADVYWWHGRASC